MVLDHVDFVFVLRLFSPLATVFSKLNLGRLCQYLRISSHFQFYMITFPQSEVLPRAMALKLTFMHGQNVYSAEFWHLPKFRDWLQMIPITISLVSKVQVKHRVGYQELCPKIDAVPVLEFSKVRRTSSLTWLVKSSTTAVITSASFQRCKVHCT